MKILNKQKDKDFVVLNLSDPQLSVNEWQEGHLNRRRLEYTLAQLMERVKPDLITVSGDLSWSGMDLAYERMGELLNGVGVPWAIVWGNHDNQGGPEYIEGIVENYSKLSNFLYESGDKAMGNGNYVILIKEDGENGKPVTAFVMMDTHNKEPYIDENGEEKKTWARLLPPQVQWFKEQTDMLKEMGCGDATLITHIPIYVYRNASAEAFKEGIDKKAITVEESYGDTCWNEGYTDSVGVEYEVVSNYPVDEGAFDVIKEGGIVRHVIAGHDHINNWIINYEGVKLVYALKIGPGCYWRPVLNGGTVMKINENGVYDIYHEYVDVSCLEEETAE